MRFMKVCIIGLGYIGFPTACVVAKAGHEVVGVDVNAEIIDKLKHGKLHIVNEDGLEDIASEVFKSGRLRVTTEPEPADAFILAVPTPYRKLTDRPGDREAAATAEGAACPEGEEGDALQFGADLAYVEASAREIVPFVRPGNLVVLESTVPPGTTDTLVCNIISEGTDLVCGRDVYVAHAPERVLPGRILKELTENDRIVGGINPESTNQAVALYRTFVHGQVLGTDATTAELVKLMENTFRDVNIALANEFALICEELGINVHEAIALANRHPRVKILKPGPGVGGHCIAVDPYFIVEAVPEKARLIARARQVNSSMPNHVIDLVRQADQQATAAGTPIRKIVTLGASYKSDVGDERESPSLEVAALLQAAGYEVSVHDPYIPKFSAGTLDEMVAGADLLVMLTDHHVYQTELKPGAIKQRMRQPWIVDTRGFFGTEWDAAGFQVVRLGVGRHLN